MLGLHYTSSSYIFQLAGSRSVARPVRLLYCTGMYCIVSVGAVPAGRVRGHRDDGAERAVRAEVQLPPPHVPRHGVPLDHG